MPIGIAQTGRPPRPPAAPATAGRFVSPTDDLEVNAGGAPQLPVLHNEIGLNQSENVRVGGPTCSFWYQALAAEEA